MPPQSDHEREKIERLRRAMYSRSLSDQLKDKPRRPLSESEQLVGEDFHREEAGVPQTTVAPRTIGLARAGLWWFLGIAIVFFLAALGYFAYYFLMGGGSLRASPGNIDIAISGPSQITAGEPSELQIMITNRNNAALQLAELVITYPEGTRSPTDFTTSLPNQRIPLGDIEAGGQRQGTVSAVFAGTQGRPADVKVSLEYRLPNSNAIFTASSIYNVSFGSSALAVDVTGNHETTSGQPVEFIVNIASNASAPLSDVLLTAQYPFGFKFISAVPAPKTGVGGSQSGFWELGNFLPGQKQVVTIRGTLSGEQGDERVFHFNAGTRERSDVNTVTTNLGNDEFAISIARPFLGLRLTVNGTTGSNIVVSPGDNVKVVVSYQNNLSTVVTDAVIAARLSGLLVDGSTVHTTDGFYRSSDDVLIWDKTTTGGALGNLAAGARGTVSFTFQAPSTEALKGIKSPKLTVSINAAGNRTSEAGVPENLQSTALGTIALASDLQLTTQGLYYANPFGSTGPMPPKAGTESTYAIVFTITNTTNKIVDAKVTAQLPPYVRWAGVYSPSSEKLIFNQLNGTVTWELGDVEAGVGLSGTPPRQAAISIGFTPSTSQIGQQPVLLQHITFTGTDATTDAKVQKEGADVTTNILGDPGFSAANATVVK